VAECPAAALALIAGGWWQGAVTGQAKYSAYRRFRLETSKAIKH